MPYAIFDCMGVFLRSGFAHVDNVIPVIEAIAWLLLSRLQGNKPRRNFPDLPNPSSWTYASIHRNPPKSSRTFRNLPPEPTPFYTGTLRNLPEPASGTYTILQRNSPEPSGTRLRNLHRNLPPEPTPFYTGTLRNFPEPSSGTGSCDPHRHTPELIWAEDPISLRCWGKTDL